MISELPTSNKSIISEYSSFDNFNFERLRFGTHYDDTNNFINRDGLTFQNYTGCMNLTGQELYCYPELAKALRELSYYPILQRTYEINKQLQGRAFLDHFCERVNYCRITFEKELAELNEFVNYLIQLYGEKRQQPIINGFELFKYYSGHAIEYITINNITWFVNTDWDYSRDWDQGSEKQTERLDLKSLLGIDENSSTFIEKAIVNTPFVGIKLRASYRQRWHLVWYNLDTLKVMTKKEIVAWQKGH